MNSTAIGRGDSSIALAHLEQREDRGRFGRRQPDVEVLVREQGAMARRTKPARMIQQGSV